MSFCYSVFVLCILHSIGAEAATSDEGFFWHLTDLHWDPSYNRTSPGVSCGASQQTNYGPFGDYLCDSPWTLINSSIYAMREINDSVDFIIWTGDDTPHNTNISKDDVATIILNVTSKILEVFPDKVVFPVLGNHDWSPKHMLPPHPDEFYDRIAGMWKQWLTTSSANETFRKCGYYKLEINNKLLLVGLNTNLYYKNDLLTNDMFDPGDQFQWLNDTLSQAASDHMKVILIGHVPPGKFEKHNDTDWYRSYYNQNFTAMLRSHSSVLGSIHFAHQHMDSFRIVYDGAGAAVSSFLIAPAVTPWETTLKGIIGGAGNNPGIRLVKYNRTDGTLLDVFQYYLNLTRANIEGNPVWELEYRATTYYNQPDMTTSSLNNLAHALWTDDALFSKYYSVNDVQFQPDDTWTPDARIIQCCAITELDYTNYTTCLQSHRVPPIQPTGTTGAGHDVFSNGTLTLLALLVITIYLNE